MVNYDPELQTVLNEAKEIWDTQLSQLQQPQVQQPAQEQQIPIPENLNCENDSDSEWDDPMDVVFSIKRNITLKIPHGLTRGPIIYENSRSNFNRDQ